MSRIIRNELTIQTEIDIFESDGFYGFSPGSDAVLAHRGITSLKPEEKVLFALALAQNNEPGFQSEVVRALSLAAEIVDMQVQRATFIGYNEDLQLIVRGQVDVKALSEKNLKIALEAIRQRQDQSK